MLLDKSSSDDETPRKRSRVSWDSESEDDALPGTSTMTVAEVVGRAPSSKKKYRAAQATLYSETEDAVPTMTVEEVADIVSSSKKKKKQKKAKKH